MGWLVYLPNFKPIDEPAAWWLGSMQRVFRGDRHYRTSSHPDRQEIFVNVMHLPIFARAMRAFLQWSNSGVHHWGRYGMTTAQWRSGADFWS